MQKTLQIHLKVVDENEKEIKTKSPNYYETDFVVSTDLDKDIFLILSMLLRGLEKAKLDPNLGLSHCFPKIQDKTESELDDSNPCVPERTFSQYYLGRK